MRLRLGVQTRAARPDRPRSARANRTPDSPPPGGGLMMRARRGGVAMDTRHYRFTVGDFECLAISDGALVGGPSYLPGPLLFANAPPPTDSRHTHSSVDAAAKEWASRTDRFPRVGHKEDPLRFTAASAAHSSGPAVPARTSCRRRPRLRFGGRRRTSAGQRDALVSVRRSADRQGDRRSVRRSRSRDAHRVDERHPLSECPAARVLAACAACPRALCRPAPLAHGGARNRQRRHSREVPMHNVTVACRSCGKEFTYETLFISTVGVAVCP